jgi:hypothetical protein
MPNEEIRQKDIVNPIDYTRWLKKKTKYWPIIILVFAILKLPIEFIAYFELDSPIGKLQVIGYIIFDIGLIVSSAYLAIAWNRTEKLFKKQKGKL